jgi:oligopeptide/dipeptide ABC transporter ATP-binding protein
VFQDPLSALNPVRTIGFQLLEALGPEAGSDRTLRRAAAVELLTAVGIAEPAARLRAYPHQLSGGMRQRVIIAIAIARQPEVLIADEPTTALDVTVQLQILGLLDDLRRERGMAMVLITHDFGVAASLCDELAVMYAGRIVERGPVEDVLAGPAHPYTAGLIGAVPRIDAPGAVLVPIPGRQPNPACPVKGCAFAPRCRFAQTRCRAEAPAETVLAYGRRYACHFPVDGS